MTDDINHDDGSYEDGVSRRNLFLGIGAAAGASAFLAAGASTASAEVGAPFAPPRAEAFGTPISGLTYMTFDALAFFADNDFGANGRFLDPTSGMNNINPPGYLSAALPPPVGTSIRQINVAYQGQPIVEIARR